MVFVERYVKSKKVNKQENQNNEQVEELHSPKTPSDGLKIKKD